MFRLGFSTHLLELVINIPGEIIGFVLLKRVNPIVAGIALCCGVIGISVEAVSLFCAYIPLYLAMGGTPLGAFTTEQVLALANLSTHLQESGLLLSWVFYGADEIASGFLFFRSGFLPRILGVLLGLAGLSYFTHGFLNFLAPELEKRLLPYILFPTLPGEGLSSLWLAIMGINVARWRLWTVPQQISSSAS